MSDRVEVVVTVDDAHAGELPGVVERLQAAGMEVRDALGALGAVSGSVDEENLAGLVDVEGVEHVERSRQFRLPPPGSDIQ